MKAIRISDERMAEVLPSEIKNTDALSDNAKKTLATIMNYFAILDIAKSCKYLVCPNSVLREAVGIRNNDLINAVQELIECDLIEREVGHKRAEGEKAIASIYRVKWNNLVKPIKKKNTFEELFAEFLKSSETPLGTTDIDTDAVPDIDTDIVSDIDVESEVDIESEFEDEVDAEPAIDIDAEDDIIKRPTDLKELNDYFIQKMEKETKGKDLLVDDLNSLETKLEAELEEEFTDIPGHENIVYLIRNSMKRKREKIIENILQNI